MFILHVYVPGMKIALVKRTWTDSAGRLQTSIIGAACDSDEVTKIRQRDVGAPPSSEYRTDWVKVEGSDEDLPVPSWVAREIRDTWTQVHGSRSSDVRRVFSLLERMVDRLGEGNLDKNPSLVTENDEGVKKETIQAILDGFESEAKA